MGRVVTRGAGLPDQASGSVGRQTLSLALMAASAEDFLPGVVEFGRLGPTERLVIPPAVKPSSRPAMLMPPGPPHRSGCTPRRGVHGQALDQGRPFGPPHQTVGLSTDGAVLP